MNEWTTAADRPGYRCKIVTHKNCTIKLYRPVLDGAEAAQNEQRVRTVLEGALRSYYARIDRAREVTRNAV